MVNRFVQCNGFQQKPAVFIFLLLALCCFYYFFVVLFSSLSFLLFYFTRYGRDLIILRPKVNALHWKESGTLWRASAEIQLYIEKKGRQSRWFWSRWIKKDKETNSTCKDVCTWIVSLSCGMGKGIAHVECLEIVVLPRMSPRLMKIAIVCFYFREHAMWHESETRCMPCLDLLISFTYLLKESCRG